MLALALTAILAWLASGCATPRAPVTDASLDRPATRPEEAFGIQSACVPEFPDRAGWYGGDAAYSVPLPIDDGRTSLWLFGDSFVRRPDGPDARSYPFVHNSIGLSRCDPSGRFRLETFWGIGESGAPRAFFEPDANADWVRAARRDAGGTPYYWLFDGFVAHDTLFVGLLRVVPAEASGPFNLPFRLAGFDLARIENFRDPPHEWRIQISTVSDRRDAFPGSAFVVSSGYVHAFAFLDAASSGSARILTRIALDRLVEWQPDVSASLETLGTDSTWIAGFEPPRAAVLMQDPASEMSVHFDAAAQAWIAVYSEVSPRTNLDTPIPIRTRTASRLEGPWSNAEVLVSIPESRPDDPRSRDENLFCYAGKAHPQFSTTTRLLVTYVCNLFARDPGEAHSVLERLRTSRDLYRPRPISVERSEPIESGRTNDRSTPGTNPRPAESVARYERMVISLTNSNPGDRPE